MPFGLGIPEVVVIIVLLATFFILPKKLPSIGRRLGQGLREIGTTGAEFRKGLRDVQSEVDGIARAAEGELRKAVSDPEGPTAKDKAAELLSK